MARILIVDDEASLVAALDYSLRREGHETAIARDGDAALEQARAIRPDLIVLDVMLPKVDGFEVCRRLRQESMVPVLMLTARDAEVDKVVGLEIGADDYMTKPFSMRELVARVKAMLRRNAAHLGEAAASAPQTERRPPPAPRPAIQVDGLRIAPETREVLSGDRPIHLKPREFELLLFLSENRGRVFSRHQLLEHVWGHDYVGDPRTVDVHVRWLREKIEADPARPRLLETVRGVGYRLAG